MGFVRSAFFVLLLFSSAYSQDKMPVTISNAAHMTASEEEEFLVNTTFSMLEGLINTNHDRTTADYESITNFNNTRLYGLPNTEQLHISLDSEDMTSEVTSEFNSQSNEATSTYFSTSQPEQTLLTHQTDPRCTVDDGKLVSCKQYNVPCIKGICCHLLGGDISCRCDPGFAGDNCAEVPNVPRLPSLAALSKEREHNVTIEILIGLIIFLVGVIILMAFVIGKLRRHRGRAARERTLVYNVERGNEELQIINPVSEQYNRPDH